MTDAHPLWEGTWATHSLTRLGKSLRNFFGVRCGSFLGFLGLVRLGETCLFHLWLCMGVSAELRMPTHKGGGHLGYPYFYQAGETPVQISWGPVR